jgi:hypothetical protein
MMFSSPLDGDQQALHPRYEFLQQHPKNVDYVTIIKLYLVIPIGVHTQYILHLSNALEVLFYQYLLKNSEDKTLFLVL